MKTKGEEILRQVNAILTEITDDNVIEEDIHILFQSLLSGLLINKPEVPIKWLSEHARKAKDLGLTNLTWCNLSMFIEEKFKNKLINDERNTNSNWIEEPPIDHIEVACNFYNGKIVRKTFSFWRLACRRNQLKQSHHDELNKYVIDYYHKRLCIIQLLRWKKWYNNWMIQKNVAFDIITRIYVQIKLKLLIRSWYQISLESKKTREYFEKVENRMRFANDAAQSPIPALETHDAISSLPKDVALKIYLHLDIIDLLNCSLVCRAWNVMLQSNKLWAKLDFYKIRKKVTDYQMKKLLFRVKAYVQALNFRETNISFLTFTGISACNNLTDLNISHCPNINDRAIETISRGCKILLYLNMSHTNITGQSLRYIGSRCPNLRYLNISFNERIISTYSVFKNMFHNLLHLNISSLQSLERKSLIRMAENCSELKSLHMDLLPQLNDQTIEKFSGHLLNLQVLSILQCGINSPSSISKWLSSLNLIRLELFETDAITDLSVSRMRNTFQNIQHLYLVACDGLNDICLKTLSNCPSLQVLNVADCWRITTNGIKWISDGSTILKLKELNVANCERITDNGIVAINRRNRTIAYFDVSFCRRLTDMAMDSIATMECLRYLNLTATMCNDQSLRLIGGKSPLTHLILKQCTQITNNGLQKLSTHCESLEKLDLSGCYQISDQGIKFVAFCCKNLRIIELNECPLLSNMSIQYLSGVSIHLQQINMSNNSLINDKCFDILNNAAFTLQKFTIKQCKNITSEGISEMMKEKNNLEIITS
ncbi:hypothetical protein SNEBB_005126 [Seison nebaliae]|nr:hypothetical protein SNEBB_005126 [Seison nebaliae]